MAYLRRVCTLVVGCCDVGHYEHLARSQLGAASVGEISVIHWNPSFRTGLCTTDGGCSTYYYCERALASFVLGGNFGGREMTTGSLNEALQRTGTSLGFGGSPDASFSGHPVSEPKSQVAGEFFRYA
jgi:hypothetical protein